MLHESLPTLFITVFIIEMFVEKRNELRIERMRIAGISLVFFSLPISTLC